MSVPEPLFLNLAFRSGLVILTVSMGLVVYRMVRGPQRADRIIALDLLSVLVVAFVSLYAVFSGEESFLDVAIAYALVAFLGTVAFARYLERSVSAGPPDRPSQTKGAPRE
jgi:multicomponent Na+:H+ antiporter subunit F